MVIIYLHPSPGLDELLESTVDRRARVGTLVEVHGSEGTLADALRGKFKFLHVDQQSHFSQATMLQIPDKHLYMAHWHRSD